MRLRRYISILFIVFLMPSCGSCTKEHSVVDDSKASDTLEIPEELYRAIQANTKPAAKKTKPAHDAANFFAIAADDCVLVGNSIEILSKVDVCGTGVAISPDGSLIAYTDTTGRHSSVHLYDIMTKKDKKLDLGTYDYYSRSFSPDGHFLAVNCFFDAYSCMVLIYDLRDGTFSNVDNPESQSLYNPTFSPDGTLLVCHDMRKVFVYSFNDGIAKHIKSISCDNLCLDNDLSMNTSCRLQLTSSHDRIVYTCAYYGTLRDNFRQLNVYNLRTGNITKVIPDNKSCPDFEVSDDGNIYFLMESDDLHSVACMAKLTDLKPVMISKENFTKGEALRVAY